MTIANLNIKDKSHRYFCLVDKSCYCIQNAFFSQEISLFLHAKIKIRYFVYCIHYKQYALKIFDFIFECVVYSDSKYLMKVFG